MSRDLYRKDFCIHHSFLYTFSVISLPPLMEELKKQATVLETKLAGIFNQAPHIPENGRSALVSFAPWLAILSGILWVLGLLGAYRAWQAYNSVVSVLWVVVQTSTWLGTGWYISILTSIITTVLSFMAYPWLAAKKKEGWDKLFYAQIVSIIGGILALFTNGSWFNLILAALIGFYLLFEIRSYYK